MQLNLPLHLVCCRITLKNATTYTSSQKLLSKSATHAVILNSIIVGDISCLLSGDLRRNNDVKLTSLSVYLFTVPVNLVYI